MPDARDLVRLLGTRFIQRRDVKAFQSDDGAWYPKREPLTMADFEAHLAGTKTLGHYLLDTENNCKLFAFDIDLVKHNRDCPGKGCKGCPIRMAGIDDQEYDVIPRLLWPQDHPCTPALTRDLRAMAEGLALKVNEIFGIPVAIATSGNKGLHVYGFTGTIPAETARIMAVETLHSFSDVFEAFRGDNFWRHKNEYHSLDIEVFPKQTSLSGKDVGNLMKMPLGVHRVTGRRAEFLSTRCPLEEFRVMEPEAALGGDLPWDR